MSLANLVVDAFWHFAKNRVMRSRYLARPIVDLAFEYGKMAFLSGPRQCGKTTLAKELLLDHRVGKYGNWDDIEFRRLWTKSPQTWAFSDLPEGGGRKAQAPFFALDEIHKAANWKRSVKGFFDTLAHPAHILVTGSARLNVYKKGGDSLLGRYLNFRMHPFSYGELEQTSAASPEEFMKHVGAPSRARDDDTISSLLRWGGFPEPFLRGSDRSARIWRRGRAEKIVREDLRDLSRLPELSRVEMLMSLLPERASQPLSVQSLREDLEVSHDTVRRWINYLRDLYYLFEVKPYSRSMVRSLKKEGKLYLYDWSEVEDEGFRFENMIACHLLKATEFWTDTGEGTFALHCLRDKEKKEIDFLVTKDRRPWLAVDCSLTASLPSSAFQHYLPKVGNPQAVHVVRALNAPAGQKNGIQLTSARDFLAKLP